MTRREAIRKLSGFVATIWGAAGGLLLPDGRREDEFSTEQGLIAALRQPVIVDDLEKYECDEFLRDFEAAMHFSTERKSRLIIGPRSDWKAVPVDEYFAPEIRKAAEPEPLRVSLPPGPLSASSSAGA